MPEKEITDETILCLNADKRATAILRPAAEIRSILSTLIPISVSIKY